VLLDVSFQINATLFKIILAQPLHSLKQLRQFVFAIAQLQTNTAASGGTLSMIG
jgi:hypothetical protein